MALLEAIWTLNEANMDLNEANMDPKMTLNMTLYLTHFQTRFRPVTPCLRIKTGPDLGLKLVQFRVKTGS